MVQCTANTVIPVSQANRNAGSGKILTSQPDILSDTDGYPYSVTSSHQVCGSSGIADDPYVAGSRWDTRDAIEALENLKFLQTYSEKQGCQGAPKCEAD